MIDQGFNDYSECVRGFIILGICSLKRAAARDGRAMRGSRVYVYDRRPKNAGLGNLSHRVYRDAKIIASLEQQHHFDGAVAKLRLDHHARDRANLDSVHADRHPVLHLLHMMKIRV